MNRNELIMIFFNISYSEYHRKINGCYGRD
jgi:hypothetical protein